MSVFVDTSALIAFQDEDDPGHGQCRDAWAGGLEAGEGFVTTDYVILESVSVVQRRWGFEAVRTLVDEFLPLVETAWVTPEDHSSGLGVLLTAGRRKLSLTDCVSFVVMRRLGVREYLGLDPHFDEQGFARYAPDGHRME